MAFLTTLALLSLAIITNAQRVVNSTFYQACNPNSQIHPTGMFVQIFDNGTINFELNAGNDILGNVTLDYRIVDTFSNDTLYMSPTIDPCSSLDFEGLCPSSSVPFRINTNFSIPSDALPENFFTSEDKFDEFRFYVNTINRTDPRRNYTVLREDCVKSSLYSTVRGGNATNETESGGGMNDTGSTNSSGGDDGGSGASTAYLNWTLLMSAVAAIVLSSSL